MDGSVTDAQISLAFMEALAKMPFAELPLVGAIDRSYSIDTDDTTVRVVVTFKLPRMAKTT